MNAKNSLTRAHHILIQLSRYISPAWIAAAGVLLITGIALFTPPYIGMADNGDFFRVIHGNGLYPADSDHSRYLGYFVKDYGIYQYYNENEAPLFSSQSLFIQFAIWVNSWFDPLHFDLRVQAAIYTLLYAAGVYLLVESLTWRVKAVHGYIIALLAIFMFGDTAYTAYFNSFYSESVVLIALLFLLASGLLLYRHRYNDYVIMACFGISALLLTTSKPQNAPAGIIVGLLGILLIFARRTKTFRVSMASLLVLVLLTGVAAYALIPKEFVNINKYHAMTRGVLQSSSDPEAALKAFGIDPQYAVLNGSIYYEPFTTVDVDSPVLENQFYRHYGFGSILAYYAAHPDQASRMLNTAAKNAFQIRPTGLGNYEKSAGGHPSGAQTHFFTGYSTMKAALAPKTFGFIMIWALLIIGLYMPSFLAALRARQMRGMLRLPMLGMMIALGLTGIAVSIIGAGDADLAKHEFLFTAAFDLVTFVVIADAIRRRLWNSSPETETGGGVQA
ncbi:hypothetical protein DCC85_21345 [Paenibacillus sp. CAA11]|uniref:glycan biosynthesis hexose transferase WsfD n=1 Tax=Paenibacillus sp. CAA11 TaxID=1532905 RepID=UPI000D3DC601|nr:hypothetical protein [Paenibacillus sp. CAA11]AWB46463.1 hypothetical protein DCC85_21345 [Paenibacillus sp. CAA11]